MNTNATLRFKDGSTCRAWAEEGNIGADEASVRAGRITLTYAPCEWADDGMTETAWFIPSQPTTLIEFDQ